MPNKEILKQLPDLYAILDSADIPETERNLRKTRIQQAAELTEDDDCIHCADLFFQRAHEIESLSFLSGFGAVHMSCDSQHEEGTDFVLNNDYYIECICASLGDTEKTGLGRFMVKNQIVDYNEKRRLMNARLTNSLCSKVDFYKKRCGKSIPSEKPYIIFLSPGRLVWEWFEEEYGMALNDVLFGRGQPAITIDYKAEKIIANGYAHVDTFKKYNEADLNSNLFCDPQFECVSGILLATEVDERYTTDNTFLFLNPFAKAKIDPSVFQGIVYWDIAKENEYGPWQNGISLAR